MAKSGIKIGISAFLLLVIGIFLIILGIKGIIDYNSPSSELKRALVSLFGGGQKSVLTLIIAILDIAAGVLLILYLFLTSLFPPLNSVPVVVVLYLAVKTGYHLFVNGISYGRQIAFQPDFISWLLLLLTNAIIILALWAAKEKA
jgi:hypothetical protein